MPHSAQSAPLTPQAIPQVRSYFTAERIKDLLNAKHCLSDAITSLLGIQIFMSDGDEISHTEDLESGASGADCAPCGIKKELHNVELQ